VKLYYRTIHYINREGDNMLSIDRNVFEEETKKARFNLYKYVVDIEGLEGICMGHHSGDIVENVFTNMIKGRNISDLTVMKEEQNMYDVIIFRPLLSLTKDNIYDMAHANNIPYFLNTTPTWSCRGVLRDQVIPILKKQFGNFEQNIIKMTQSCEYYTSYHDNMMQKTKDSLEIVSMEYATRMKYSTDIVNMILLENILLDIMHGNKYPMISHKSRDNLMTWLKGDMKSMLDLSGTMFCYHGTKYLKGYIYFVNYKKIVDMKPERDYLFSMLDNYFPQKLRTYYK
jgi:tRNA(Ile)-lysidine synthase TilS/MesJ